MAGLDGGSVGGSESRPRRRKCYTFVKQLASPGIGIPPPACPSLEELCLFVNLVFVIRGIHQADRIPGRRSHATQKVLLTPSGVSRRACLAVRRVRRPRAE